MNTAARDRDMDTPSRLAFINRLAPLAWPGVRIITGLWLMPHGAQKLFGWFGGHGLTGTGQYFESIGITPGVTFALVAGIVEFFGGLALALGLLTRFVALIVAGLLLVALTTHLPNGFFWTQGGYEYPLMWFFLALALFLRGAGRFSLDIRFDIGL